jgi:hypothetical protein
MMSDLLRFLAVLACAAFLGCLGYWIGFLFAAHLPTAGPSLAVLGSILGLVIGALFNSGPWRKTQQNP